MSLVAWTDKPSVDVKSIDDQHTVLFETISDLHVAMLKGQSRSVVGTLLRTLVAYTREHFTAEEAMMEAAKYPALAAHRIKHTLGTDKASGRVFHPLRKWRYHSQPSTLWFSIRMAHQRHSENGPGIWPLVE